MGPVPLEVRLPRFNAWMRERGGGEEFRIGIGLNTAARLEGMTKGTEHQIFLSDSTRELLSGDPVRLAFVDSMPVRGRAEQIKVWAPVAAAGGPVGPSEPES